MAGCSPDLRFFVISHDARLYQDQPFFVLAKPDLIAAKRAAGRPVDLEDVRILELP
jgi:hypothetical protein